MSRPKPPILCHGNITEIDSIDVLDVPQQWIITYKQQLISVVRHRQGSFPKYLKTTYATYAPACNMATKLNNLFECDDFGVKEIR